MENDTNKKEATTIRHTFNTSPEISYWAKKLNIDAIELQKRFEEMGYSMNKTIASYQKK